MRRSWFVESDGRVVFVALLLAVSACGGNGTGAPGKGTETPSASKNQINPMPREKLQDGGTFTYALESMPPNFNYNELDGPGILLYVISALMPSPFSNDARGTPVWDRNYLASEPKLTTDPKQIVTYEINPKAIWYDGTPITWQDFYWQWKSTNGTNKAYQIAAANGYEVVENVERGKDDREVVVTFKQKYADWTNVFSPLYPASTNKDPKIFNGGWKTTMLTSAGPFRLAGINQTSQTITLVRNEKWWGAKAKLDTIVFRIIDVNAEIDALANGEVDAIDIGPIPSSYSRAKDMDGIDVRVAGGPNFRHLTMNGTSPNLQDVKVRQALAMSIDRSAIAKAELGPLGIDPKALGNHIFMTNQEGYQDNSGEVGTYNPAQARQLLDEAGWKLDGGVRKKNGKALEITCVIPSGVQASRQEAELIQNMVGQIGATMTINTVPGNDLFDKYVIPGQFDFTVFSWLGNAYPISENKSIYGQPVRAANGQLDVKQNFARIGSDAIDRLLDQAGEEFDRSKAEALANQADTLIWQEVHSLTLYQRPELIAVKKDLANFGAFGFATWDYQDIGWVKP